MVIKMRIELGEKWTKTANKEREDIRKYRIKVSELKGTMLLLPPSRFNRV